MTDTKLILAPIRGLTDLVYRNAIADCFPAFDRAIAPFIKVRQGKELLPSETAQLLPDRQRLKTIPQVHTNHAPSFLQVLHEFHRMGHGEVNWNLGCPYPMVAKRQRGAGLLPHPERIDQILTQVLAESPVQISVKIRLGYHDATEYQAVIDVLNQHSICELTVHPRIATQLYAGQVDLDHAVEAYQRCRHPFVYNGDIFDVSDFEKVRALMPECAGWMLGRGVLRDPFLGMTLLRKELSIVDRRSRLREFHERLLTGYRATLSTDGHVLRKMADHWEYLIASFPASQALLKKIRHSKTLDEYQGVAERILATY